MVTEDFVERATTFNGSDASAGKRLDDYEYKKDYYRRLSVHNSLRWNGKWKDRRRETAKTASAIVDAVAGQLELTPYQKEEAHRKFSQLPDRYNKAYSTALLALCICGLVGRQDGRNYHPNQIHPDSNVHNQLTDFAGETKGIYYRSFYKCWCAVKHEVFN